MKLFTLTPGKTGTLHIFNEPLSFVAGVPIEVPQGYRDVLLAYRDGGFRFVEAESAPAPPVQPDAEEPVVEFAPSEPKPTPKKPTPPAAKPASKKK